MQPVAMVIDGPGKIFEDHHPGKTGFTHDSVFAETKAAWTKLYPMKPFRGYYQDELAAEAAKVNESIATIFSWFAHHLRSHGSHQHVCTGFPECVEKIEGNCHPESSGRGRQAYFLNLCMKGYSWIIIFVGRYRLLCRLCTFQIVDGSDIPDQCRRKFLFAGIFFCRCVADLCWPPSAPGSGWC